MKLYYTVASQPEDIQPKPSLSLGGFKSSSLVPNSVIGNLFSDISMYSVKNNNANNYIALILVNDGAKAVTDILIWFIYTSGCVSVMKLDAVDLATDTDGNKYMEHVPNFTSKPLYATFAAAAEVANAINIGNLAINGSLGLWIERSLDLATLRTQQNAIYTPDAVDTYRYVEVVLPKEDSIGIGLSWTEVTP